MSRTVKDPVEHPYQEAHKQREKALSAALKRKEEFLGARVPKELRNRVIDRANALGIPVSILIRNILEDAFVDSPQGSQHRTGFGDVVGWEEIRLQRVVACSACGKRLDKGEGAHFGLGASVATVLCRSCLENQ